MTSFGGFCGEIMHKDVNLLALKINSSRKYIFLLIFTNYVQFKAGMRSMAEFYLLRS